MRYNKGGTFGNIACQIISPESVTVQGTGSYLINAFLNHSMYQNIKLTEHLNKCMLKKYIFYFYACNSRKTIWSKMILGKHINFLNTFQQYIMLYQIFSIRDRFLASIFKDLS